MRIYLIFFVCILNFFVYLLYSLFLFLFNPYITFIYPYFSCFRYISTDPYFQSMEAILALLGGPLLLVFAWATYVRAPHR